MTISPTVAKCAEICEQQHGRKPDEVVLQMVEYIYSVGKILMKQGKKDAQEGKKPCPADEFTTLVVSAFRMDVDKDHEIVQLVSDLWQSYYMGGYNREKEANSCDH